MKPARWLRASPSRPSLPPEPWEQLLPALIIGRASSQLEGLVGNFPRRDGDLNPGDGYPPTRSPGVPLRPLGHPSALDCTGPSGRHSVHRSPNLRLGPSKAGPLAHSASPSRADLNGMADMRSSSRILRLAPTAL